MRVTDAFLIDVWQQRSSAAWRNKIHLSLDGHKILVTHKTDRKKKMFVVTWLTPVIWGKSLAATLSVGVSVTRESAFEPSCCCQFARMLNSHTWKNPSQKRPSRAECNVDWHYRKWKETTKWGRQGWQNLKINTSWHIFSCNILKTDRLVKFNSHVEVDYSSNAAGLNELEKKSVWLI